MAKPPPAPAVLSIQSQVVAGHVGNGAAQPALQRLGFEVWALPTIILSNHPGHGSFRGRATDPGLLGELLDGLDQGGWLTHCVGVLTGYLATTGAAAVAQQAMARVRAAHPGALVLVDPVMGDAPKGLYVAPELVEIFRAQLVPRADIVTPNRFELELLAGHPVASLEAALAAARILQAGTGNGPGPDIVLCTSFERGAPAGDRVETLAVARDGAWIARAPRLDNVPNGAGDLMASLFLAARLKGAALPEALGQAAAATWRVLAASVALGSDELALVPAMESLLGSMADAEVQQVA